MLWKDVPNSKLKYGYQNAPFHAKFILNSGATLLFTHSMTKLSMHVVYICLCVKSPVQQS